MTPSIISTVGADRFKWAFGGSLVGGYQMVLVMIHWLVECVRTDANPPLVLIVQLEKKR